MYREPNVSPSYNFVQNCRIRGPWYGSIQLVETHRTIPGRHGFDNFGRSYSSAVHWPAPLFTFSSSFFNFDILFFKLCRFILAVLIMR
ncbi:unnamed protein product [Meloidogyne enterolobii]|uniref:Uncharacterized protein n=1 Tax=Meloidogyne enterolobii TaxID=390850 RepID=A0ACB1B5R0_MELEN